MLHLKEPSSIQPQAPHSDPYCTFPSYAGRVFPRLFLPLYTNRSLHNIRFLYVYIGRQIINIDDYFLWLVVNRYRRKLSIQRRMFGSYYQRDPHYTVRNFGTKEYTSIEELLFFTPSLQQRECDNVDNHFYLYSYTN